MTGPSSATAPSASWMPKAAQSVIDTFRACGKNSHRCKERNARRGCRLCSWAKWQLSESPANSSRRSARKSSGARRFATPTYSSWRMTTSATFPISAAFDRGGYQVWTGLHSFLERGTGELIVRAALDLLSEFSREAAGAPARSDGPRVRNSQENR